MKSTFPPRLGPGVPAGRRLRPWFISTYPPRRCGIATFTSHLVGAVESSGVAEPVVVAISDHPGCYRYPEHVAGEIRQHHLADYEELSQQLNQPEVDLVCVQHEFGIYGGYDGEYLVTLLEGIRKPIVTTLHTVLTSPSPSQIAIIRELAYRSQMLVVMARKAAEFLTRIYSVNPSKVAVIPHGVPVVHRQPAARLKKKYGLTGRRVLSTFGLINPGKGIEYALEALAPLVARHPDLLYLVIGETHPGVRAHSGESYRQELERKVEEYGLQQHVQFINQFLTDADVLNYLMLSDIYLTPYVNREQITSGTLAYAVGLGKAIVSTPYYHAAEVLANGRGILVPFRDAQALSRALDTILASPERQAQLEARARAIGEGTSWPEIGQRYVELFAGVLETSRRRGRSVGLPLSVRNTARLLKPSAMATPAGAALAGSVGTSEGDAVAAAAGSPAAGLAVPESPTAVPPASLTPIPLRPSRTGSPPAPEGGGSL